MPRREVSPQGELVKFNEPVTVEGFYLGRERKKIDPFPEGWFYSVEDTEGNVWSFFGTKIINDKMEKIDVGEYVTLVYEGKTAKTKAGTTFKHFRIYAGQEEDGATDPGQAPTPASEEANGEQVPF